MESSKITESLDTSVILRAITGDIPEQSTRAKNLIEDSGSSFFVADVVIFEVVYVLQKFYAWPRVTIATVLAGIISKKNIDCDQSLLLQVLDDYVTHPKLSFADCYLAWKTRLNDATPLWTFDQKLASQMPVAKLVAS